MSELLSVILVIVITICSPGKILTLSWTWIGFKRSLIRDFQFQPFESILEATKKKKKRTPLTVSGAMSKYGGAARKKLRAKFTKANLSYPPKELVLIGLKQEEKLLVYARDDDDSEKFKKILEYPILGTSGVSGPKLKQGDFQMPEGFYKISAFNPNSRFHLSLRVNYPNEEDRTNAKLDKRTNLGGDIMIHGSDCSIGCLAMGDSEIEEIFTLVYDTGRGATKVLLAPCDLTRTKPIIDMKKQPKWLPGLYKRIKESLTSYLNDEI